MIIYALYLAVILYGLFSNPTPDMVGWAEYSIIALLVISIGVLRPLQAITARGLSLPLFFHRIFWAFLLIVPTVIGLTNGHTLPNMLRDFIPIAILILPLCFYNDGLEGLSFAMAIAGGLFALRYLLPMLPPIDFLPQEEQPLLYLANAPLVAFGAIMGFAWFSDTHDNAGILQRLGGILISATCFIAMAMMLQRAPLILCAVACLVILGMRTVHKPLQSMVIGAVIMVICIPFMTFFTDIFNSLEAKTLTVGWNNRIEEFETVLNQASIFGYGWGSEIQSPAVADIWVRYTHNFISYLIFKAGMIGGLLGLGFIIIWAGHLLRMIKDTPAIGIAIFIPFIIHVTLYTGFKTLDFALLLTLACTACARNTSSS